MRVGIVTCSALPGLAPDDRHLMTELREVGAEPVPVVWEDKLFAPESVDVLVIRSAWDYAYRRDEFVEAIARFAAVRPIWASPRVVAWNTHKAYLLELQAKGIPIIPTHVIRRGERIAALPFGDMVVKAAVAQTGRYFLRTKDAEAAQSHLARITRLEDALLQPYMPSIELHGERSLVFIGGELTHVVEKRAPAGQSLVHDDFGGTVTLVEPAREEWEVAAAAVEVARDLVGELLYARVDLVRDTANAPVVMELELVEPELFFRFAPHAVQALARALTQPRRKAG